MYPYAFLVMDLIDYDMPYDPPQYTKWCESHYGYECACRLLLFRHHNAQLEKEMETIEQTIDNLLSAGQVPSIVLKDRLVYLEGLLKKL